MKMNISYFADFGSKNRPYTGGYYFAEQLLYILKELNVNLTIFSAVIPKIDKNTGFVNLKKPHPGGEVVNDIIEVKLPIGGFGNPFVGLKWIFQLKDELKKLPKQDLYIFDQPNTPINFLPKAPTITMFHGSDFVKIKNLSLRNPRNFLYSIFWRKLFLNKIHKKFLTKEIGIPIFNSNDTLNRLCADFNLDPHPLEKYITYLPIDTEKFKKDENERIKIRKQFRISDDDVVIIALSNFDPVKRADRLSSAISKILKEQNLQNVKFLLVGGGRKSEPIDHLVNLKMGEGLNKIIRIGEVSHNDVYKYYSASDIALSTSERESFGYFITEGMSCELPFVAYRGGAIEEVIENNETGFIVENEQGFINKLLELINNKNLRQKMGVSGRERIKKMFSMEVFKSKLLKILNQEFNFNL